MSNRKATHKELVEYVSSGHSITETQEYFQFSSYNTANSCISRAFKKLGVPRPTFHVSRICPFCKRTFTALSKGQISCKGRECVNAYSNIWQKRRRNLLRTAKSKLLITEIWHISLQRVVSGIVKYYSRHTDSIWKYRFLHIQRKARFRPTQQETKEIDKRVTLSMKGWKEAIDEVQRTCNALRTFTSSSDWEKMARNISSAIIAESKMRGW